MHKQKFKMVKISSVRIRMPRIVVVRIKHAVDVTDLKVDQLREQIGARSLKKDNFHSPKTVL